jgi:alpha-mannosidase
MDMAWSVVRPQIDQIPGACKNWFAVQRWVDISNDKYGVTWLTPDAPLVEVGGITANLIGSMSLGDWITNLPPSQTLYSWAMNNHWHTNYRAEQDGPTVFRYYIFPHDGSTGADAAARLALEHDQPLLVLPARGEPPKEPRFRVQGTRSNYQVTAFKPSADGKAWIVRLFGMSDTPEDVRLTWTDPQPKRAWLSDNSERPMKPIDGSFEIPAWSIVTVRAEM